MPEQKENPVLSAIRETGPEDFVKVVNRAMDCLVAFQDEFKQPTFQDDYYQLSRLRDALLEWGGKQ